MTQLKPIRFQDQSKTVDPLADVLLRTKNFQIVQNTCQMAVDYNRFVGLTGDAGYGKSIALKYYASKNPNVFVVTASASMLSKIFWAAVLDKLGAANKVRGAEFDYAHRSLYHIIDTISQKLNKLDRPLLIIDEAGKITPRMLLDVHTLRDATRCGIILSGPDYFRDNLEKWATRRKPGVAEFYSRINTWVELKKPTLFELKKICESRGVTDPEVMSSLIYGCGDFRSLTNKITQYLIETK